MPKLLQEKSIWSTMLGSTPVRHPIAVKYARSLLHGKNTLLIMLCGIQARHPTTVLSAEKSIQGKNTWLITCDLIQTIPRFGVKFVASRLREKNILQTISCGIQVLDCSI